MKNLLAKDIKPRDIMTKGAFENAIRMVMMTGGSTNAVLHLIAMSRSCQDPEVAISLDDFQRISNEVWTRKSQSQCIYMFVSLTARFRVPLEDSVFGGSQTLREIRYGGCAKHWWNTWDDQVHD